MLIIDAQVHIWGKGLPTNPSHRQITSFTADDLLKEAHELVSIFAASRKTTQQK